MFWGGNSVTFQFQDIYFGFWFIYLLTSSIFLYFKKNPVIFADNEVSKFRIISIIVSLKNVQTI